MILIGLGSNLESLNSRTPAQNLTDALALLEKEGLSVVNTSTFHETAPLPSNSGPWYTNAVAEVFTETTPQNVLRILLDVEKRLGRVRSTPNAPRVIDLDLLDFHGQVINEMNLVLPHPRMAERAFVLAPLNEIAPDWRHPVLGKSATTLLDEVKNEQIVLPIKC